MDTAVCGISGAFSPSSVMLGRRRGVGRVRVDVGNSASATAIGRRSFPMVRCTDTHPGAGDHPLLLAAVGGGTSGEVCCPRGVRRDVDPPSSTLRASAVPGRPRSAWSRFLRCFGTYDQSGGAVDTCHKGGSVGEAAAAYSRANVTGERAASGSSAPPPLARTSAFGEGLYAAYTCRAGALPGGFCISPVGPAGFKPPLDRRDRATADVAASTAASIADAARPVGVCIASATSDALVLARRSAFGEGLSAAYVYLASAVLTALLMFSSASASSSGDCGTASLSSLL